MPRALCPVCRDHPAALPSVLCQACRRQALRDLDALPEWDTALLTPPRRAAQQRVTGGATSAPAPALDTALQARADIRARLVAWALHLAQAHHVPVPAEALATGLSSAADQIRQLKFAALDHADDGRLPEALAAVRGMLAASRHAVDMLTHLDRLASLDAVPALAAHLTEHAEVLLADEASAPRLAVDLGRLVDRAQAVAAPDHPHTMPIGRCPDCGGAVLADPHNCSPGHELDTIEAWCTRCEDRGVLRWWRTRLPAPAEWLPPGRLRMHLLLAHDVEVSMAQLWQWASRGHVETRGTGRRTEYRVADALERGKSVPTRGSRVHTVSDQA